MVRHKGSILVIISFMLLVILFWGCSKGQKAAKEEGKIQNEISEIRDQYQKKKELVVGTSPDYPPFEFYVIEGDTTSDLVGLDIDIASEIAKDLGVKLKIKVYPFHKLFTILNKGEVDFVIAGINPSEKRKPTTR